MSVLASQPLRLIIVKVIDPPCPPPSPRCIIGIEAEVCRRVRRIVMAVTTGRFETGVVSKGEQSRAEEDERSPPQFFGTFLSKRIDVLGGIC